MEAMAPRGARGWALWSLLALLGVAAILWLPVLASGDLMRNLWGPAHLLVHGQSPYRVGELWPGEQAVWLPVAIGLFAPLGWLPADAAARLWLALSLAALVLVVVLSAITALPRGEKRPRPAVLCVALILAALFPPTLQHLAMGQYTLLALALLLLSVRSAADGRWLLAGALLAPTLTKPQLIVLVLPGILLVAWRGGGIRALLRLLASLFGTSAALLVPLWWGYPGWASDFAAATAGNPSPLRVIGAALAGEADFGLRWVQPTLYSLLTNSMGAPGLLLWTLLALAGGAACTLVWWRRPPMDAAPWALALTLLVSPYLWSYDFVLAVPLLTARAFSAGPLHRTVVGAGAAVVSAVALGAHLAATTPSDAVFWWVPFALLGTLAAAEGLAAVRRAVPEQIPPAPTAAHGSA